MDYFLIAYGALLLALSFFFGKYGSLWIDRLYLKNHSILSFPDAVGSRARYRVKLLTLLFFLTGIRLFFVSQGIILVLSLALCGLLLLIIATDFEQYCIFNDMIIPLAAGGVLCCALFLPIAIDHLISAAAGGVLFLIIAILSRGALGGGDIKLIACLGLWMGTKTLFWNVWDSIWWYFCVNHAASWYKEQKKCLRLWSVFCHSSDCTPADPWIMKRKFFIV
jgi:leader peptidase (prepilin peptidase)/N-methyltransferase